MGGVKVGTRIPTNSPSLNSIIVLSDIKTGETKALIDGIWITQMRTGAVATHSIVTFAKKDFYSIGIIGLGNVARATLIVLLSVIKQPLNIKLLRYKNQAEIFEKRFKNVTKNTGLLTFSVVDKVRECIQGSDVILSCATYFADDVAEDSWFDEGITLIPVHTRGFSNCDLFFDKIFADDVNHVKHFKNFSKFPSFFEVTDVVKDHSLGRKNNKERILVYNIGVATHDINFATKIYQMFEEKDFIGLQDVKMDIPKEKFWV